MENRKIENILKDVTEIVKVSHLAKNNLSTANISLLKNGKYKWNKPAYTGRVNDALKIVIEELQQYSKEIDLVLESVNNDI